MENSERDGNTRPPDLSLEKPVCRSGRTVKTGHGTTEWFQIVKGVPQGCILSLCLFKFYAEKCWTGRNKNWNQDRQNNINNLRYADHANLMAESEEELKSLLMKVKEKSENIA